MIKSVIMDGITAIVSAGIAGGVAAKLIDKIADATGVLYEPRKIKKLAKAEADAAIDRAKAETHLTVERVKAAAIGETIKIENQIENFELQRRASQRLLQEEVKKQENLEDIMEKTIPLLKEGSKPEKIDDDWLMNYVDKAKLISDDEMKTLWAKILAGEANNPNSFSKRTVNFLGSMDKIDAEIFNAVCRYSAIFIGNPTLFFYGENPIYNDLTFSRLTHLDSIGLIKYDNITTFSLTESTGAKQIGFSYFEKGFSITFKDLGNPNINIGSAMFTQLGLEIFQLCKIEPVLGFADFLFGKLKEQSNLEIDFGWQATENQEPKKSVSIARTDTDFVKIFNSAIDGGDL
jgi:Protein of unknown function (DUF2806)